MQKLLVCFYHKQMETEQDSLAKKVLKELRKIGFVLKVQRETCRESEIRGGSQIIVEKLPTMRMYVDFDYSIAPKHRDAKLSVEYTPEGDHSVLEEAYFKSDDSGVEINFRYFNPMPDEPLCGKTHLTKRYSVSYYNSQFQERIDETIALIRKYSGTEKERK